MRAARAELAFRGRSLLTSYADDGIVVVMTNERMTTDAYLQGDVTNLPHELVYGVLRDAASPTPNHQSVAGNIYRRLWQHLSSTQTGRAWMAPLDVILDRERALVVQPDVIVVMNGRLHIVTDRVWGAPDLVIEVLSPHPRIGKLDERLKWFAEHGVRECWLARHLEGQIEVVTFNGSGYTIRSFENDEVVRSAVLEDLTLTANELLDRW